MSEASPLSPEARREERETAREQGLVGPETLADENPFQQIWTVAERTSVGVYNDGFTFAGNFAYLSLLAVFSFFIVIAAIAGSIGQATLGADFVDVFLQTMPPEVADALRGPVGDAMNARTGPLLWLSAAVGLWTAASLIETIREVLHRAYGVVQQRAFWEYRLRSIGLIITAVFFVMLALSAQFLIVGADEFIAAYVPMMQDAPVWLSLSRLLPFLTLFVALYLLFRLLTPRDYRSRRYPKWPGAVVISMWWLVIITLLPLFLKYAVSYKLTYGSLAGVMITLIFFYLVGLGMVTGAELNAALAESPEESED